MADPYLSIASDSFAQRCFNAHCIFMALWFAFLKRGKTEEHCFSSVCIQKPEIKKLLMEPFSGNIVNLSFSVSPLKFHVYDYYCF